MVKVKNKEMEASFEAAIQELENIVRLLEDGSLQLDEALAKFEQGIKLARFCSKKLAEAEQKIDFLLSTQEGEIVLKPVSMMEDRNE